MLPKSKCVASKGKLSKVAKKSATLPNTPLILGMTTRTRSRGGVYDFPDDLHDEAPRIGKTSGNSGPSEPVLQDGAVPTGSRAETALALKKPANCGTSSKKRRRNAPSGPEPAVEIDNSDGGSGGAAASSPKKSGISGRFSNKEHINPPFQSTPVAELDNEGDAASRSEKEPAFGESFSDKNALASSELHPAAGCVLGLGPRAGAAASLQDKLGDSGVSSKEQQPHPYTPPKSASSSSSVSVPPHDAPGAVVPKHGDEVDDSAPLAKSRKVSSRKPTVLVYPRRELPEDVASECRKKWQERWGVDKPKDPVSVEERLRSCFWWTAKARPRCYSCKVGGHGLPEGLLAPDGTEERELLPCGCLVDAAMLEMWCVKKGMFHDANIERPKREKDGLSIEHLGPKTLGKHKILLLRFWEMLFGPFNVQTLLNRRGMREEMLRQFCDKEEEQLLHLSPNPGYIRLTRVERRGRKKKLKDLEELLEPDKAL